MAFATYSQQGRNCSKLVVIFLLIHLGHQDVVSATLSSYLVSSFTSPDTSLPFNHITVYNVTGDVYIGARERLYQLNPDLTLYQTVTLEACPASGENTPNNDNKLLVVAPSPVEQLVTCGSCDGYCETRSLTNISQSVTRHDNRGRLQEVVVTGNAQTVGTITLGSDLTSDGDGTKNAELHLFTGRSVLVGEPQLSQPVRKHELISLYADETVGDYVTGNDLEANHFIQTISDKEYIFYFIQRTFTTTATSHIGRLCPNSLDLNLNSYTEIEIQCTQGNDVYSVIAAAHIGPARSELAESSGISSADGVAYAVFTTQGGNKSALCTFNMSTIQEHFKNAVDSCIKDDNLKGKPSDIIFGSECGTLSEFKLDASLYECTARPSDSTNHAYTYASGVRVTPQQAEPPLLTWSGAIPTSIITLTERSNTVAFIGTSEGHLLKIHLVNKSTAYMYENISVSENGGSILRDMFFDEENEELTIATSSEGESQVLKLSIANCSQYESCEECIGVDGGNDGDPYCGWCTLEARCTRYDNCSLPNESTRWLSYNATQCPVISYIQPSDRLSYNQPEQQIGITVEKLPDLKDTFQYECSFDKFTTSATTNGNTVTCVTPPLNDLPSIPEGYDNATIVLSIKSMETDIKFVSTSFSFYNCSFFTSCSSCVISSWACDWCVYGNKCTDDNSTCQADDDVVTGQNNTSGSVNKGQAYCPQILQGDSTDVLIPVGFARSYSLLADNLPLRDTSYECILVVEGEHQTVTATFVNETYIVCEAKEYDYSSSSLTLDVQVFVRWNYTFILDDVSETKVTLYKCSVSGESCSQCLSNVTTPTELECGWCETECAIAESGVCQGNFLSQINSSRCPGPEITSFYPISGPVAGNTRLEINGTDLGVSFSEISSIYVGEVKCDLTGMIDFYEPGQSISCLTTPGTANLQGTVDLTLIVGQDTRSETSDGEFVYRNPRISGFEPMAGPEAGGTRVTISGEYLNTGRDITARFGDAECIDLVVTTNEANCTTTAVNGSANNRLIMAFDSSNRTSSTTFIYVANPEIEAVENLKAIFAGGNILAFKGSKLDVIQEPRIVSTSIESYSMGAENSEVCNAVSDTELICPTPGYPEGDSSRRKRDVVNRIANLSLDLDGFRITLGEITYYPDPEYFNINATHRIAEISDSRRLAIEGKDLNLASVASDVRVLIGLDGECIVDVFQKEMLGCKLPPEQPKADADVSIGQGDTVLLPSIRIYHGNVEFFPGYVQYEEPGLSQSAIGGIAAGAALFLLIILVVVGVCLYRRSNKALDKQAEELELVEKKIQEHVEAAFHDLQADMSEVEQQVKGLGIPFVNTKDYMKNILFSGLEILPATSDPEYLESDLERAMIMFSRQLNNPEFLMSYIHLLEEKRKTHRRDRVNIASLITVILASEGKFDYYTDILLRLLEEQISDGADSGRLKSLFRRTETIVEKLLSNWMSLCMYLYLKKHVAESLYLLYQSIKIQVEKGPVDVVTGQAYYCLNFDCLMEENVEFEEVTLSVTGSDDKHEFYVKVLGCDCISQAKQKILDAAYRRKHIVKQNRAHEMDMIWYHPGGEQKILRDRDEYTKPMDNSTSMQINTIKSVGVTESSRVALIEKVDKIDPSVGNYQPVTPGAKMFYIYDEEGTSDARTRDYTRIQTHHESGQRICHLIPEENMVTDGKASKSKLDKEFSAPHLLVTKKTIEPFLNRFLQDVFENPSMTPSSIKHLFDFFDKMSARYSSENAEVHAETWKSNSLPQHYWMTALTHPSYIFDMRQSRSADQSVSVLANMLDNACKKIIPEKKHDASLNRILFVKDLPVIIKTISKYYEDIKNRPTPTREELRDEFSRIGQEFSGRFSRVGTLKQLYDFTFQDTGELLDSITEAL